MSITVIGLIVSGTMLAFLVLLFRHETVRGARYGERARTQADFFVLKTSYTIHKMMRFIGRDFIRQAIHYVFHTILRFVLAFVALCEHGLRNVMHVNRTLAKNAERESVSRNKLEEIALHKVASALSEEEKREHREKTLNGS